MKYILSYYFSPPTYRSILSFMFFLSLQEGKIKSVHHTHTHKWNPFMLVNYFWAWGHSWPAVDISKWGFLKKAGNRSTSRSIYTTLGHIPQRLYTLLQRYLIINAHCCSIHYRENLEIAKCLSTGKWITKIWFIYTIEYYLAFKKTEIIKFEGKLMDLETFLVSEVSQIQKVNYCIGIC